MKTEQPEMDARFQPPENPVSVQGRVTPLTSKTPKFNEQHVCETDQQHCNHKNNSSLKQEEPEPLQIKEEQEDFWISKEIEQFIPKQEIDAVMVTSIHEENELREPEPNSEQLLCLTSTVTEKQDEEGSQHIDSGSTESEELKPKKRRLKTRSYYEEQHVFKNELGPDQLLCNQENNSSLEQRELKPLQIKEDPEPLWIKEEQEESWSSQEVEQFIQKQETDIFMATSISVKSEHREPEPNSEQLLGLTSAVTENQEEEGRRHVDSGSTESEELKPRKRRLKTRIHYEEQNDFKEGEVHMIHQLYNQERNDTLDQDKPDPAQVKEEEEELCISQDEEQFELTFEYNGDSDNSECGSDSEHIRSNSCPDTESQYQDTGININPASAQHVKPKSKKRLHRNSKNVDDTPVSENSCNTDNCEKSLTKRPHTFLKPEKRYACSICEKRFKYPSQLEQHIRTHTGHKPYCCETCGTRFTQSYSLTLHMRVHTGDKPYACETCMKPFARNSDLRLHMRIHSGEKRYFCKMCGKGFPDSSNFTKHMNSHTGDKPYSCETCGKCFSQRGSLTTHMRIHTGNKPYFCETCSTSFTYCSSLTKHMRMHTGAKPYSCESCGKRFTQSSNLSAHMKIHTGDKVYPCEMCGKVFTFRSNLTRHMKIHTDKV
ncbi:uncharacterized protein KZ484_000187 isoform 1-T2 [Pholidichthys leucotaenia]